MSSARPLHVLVVDDNQDAADVLGALLETAGFSASVAYDASSAVAAATARAPDIALLDLGLPVSDGFELASQLRALDGLADLKLIAITGYSSHSLKGRSREAGFRAHFIKPVQFEALLEMIRAL